MNMAKSMRLRLRAIECLKILKENQTYLELSKLTGLPITVLNRYILGKVLPSEGRALEFIKLYEKKFDLKSEVRRRIGFDEEGYFDNSKILYDTLLMKRISEHVFERFSIKKIDKVLTSETDGIPLGCLISSELGVPFLFAKKHREVGVRRFIEERYIPDSSGRVLSFFLPRGSISKGDKILIVDDVIRTGETQKTLISMVRNQEAKIAGIFVIVSVGKRWMNLLKDEEI
ncbi:MAG: phosphoribosyltransferase family protein, partial [Candidatus Methanofastidiosia archaeon]